MNKTDLKTQIGEKYESLRKVLNERSRRMWAATEARAIGRGGQILVAQATGIHKNTILAGMKEIQEKKNSTDVGRIRHRGGGRKRNTEKDKTNSGDTFVTEEINEYYDKQI